MTILLGEADITLEHAVTLSSGASILGFGADRTRFRLADGARVTAAITTGPKLTTDVTLHGFDLDLNRAHVTADCQEGGIWLNRVARVEIRDVHIRDYYGMHGCRGGSGVALAVAYGEDVLISENLVMRAGDYPQRSANDHPSDGIYVQGRRIRLLFNRIEQATDTGLVAENVDDVEIRGNEVVDSTQAITISAPRPGMRVHRVSVIGNTVSGGLVDGGYGINVLGAKSGAEETIGGVEVLGNEVHDSAHGAGIQVLDARDVSLLGNRVRRVGTAAVEGATREGMGIVVERGSRVTIAGNVVDQVPQRCVWLRGGDAVKVEGNTLSRCGTVGIQVGSTRSFRVAGNTLVDVSWIRPHVYSAIAVGPDPNGRTAAGSIVANSASGSAMGRSIALFQESDIEVAP